MLIVVEHDRVETPVPAVGDSATAPGATVHVSPATGLPPTRGVTGERSMHVSPRQVNPLPTLAAIFRDAVVPAPAITLSVVAAPVAGSTTAQGIVAAVPTASLADTC